MLLRLLPIATPAQPSPPTILFTLPLPSHPYTARSLPLPPNLLAHRSVCLQEDIHCSNVLLGEKSSWVGGIIDDVTFSLPQSQVSVLLIDGTTLSLPLTDACVVELQQVISQVHLSFSVVLAPPPPPPVDASPRSSTSSMSSTSSSSSAPAPIARPSIVIPSRRSPSSLLLTLLSPLLSSSSQAAPKPQASYAQSTARAHRRQARSLLVDAYRRHVLPCIKQHLPAAYLTWAISSETAKKNRDFDLLREEILATLAAAGISRAILETHPAPLRRCDSRSSCSDSGSDDDDSPGPITPSTSIFSHSSTPPSPRRSASDLSPQSFLLAIPPAHALPSQHRQCYSDQLARLTSIASRLQSIKRLQVRYDREEGKRRWLESMEHSRMSDKARRRAYSNGLMPQLAGSATTEPVRPSKLWSFFTPESVNAEPQHPAMADDELEPTIDTRHRVSTCSSASTCFEEKENRPPSLVSSRSDESLSSTTSDEDWEANAKALSLPLKTITLLPPMEVGVPWEKKQNTIIKTANSKHIEWSQEDESLIYYGHVGV
ncbi:hypothetical protein P7C73_g3413, partial [Tremellales sp. Uapishka_1]